MFNKKKIFVIVPELRHGGTEKFILNLLTNLKNNFDISICCIGAYDNYFLDNYKKDNLNIIFLNSSIKFVLFKLIREINKNKPDIVFSNLWAANILSAICKLLSFHKFKLLLREGNPYLKEINYKLPFFLIKFLISISYLISNKIIMNTKGLENHILEYSLFDIKNKSMMINNGININEIKENNRRKNSEIIKLLNISKLRSQKDLETIFKAVKILSTKHNCILTIVGDGEEKEKLINKAKKIKILDKICFEGNKNFLDGYYNSNDIFIFSSFYEGGPNVILESLKYDIPIISSDCNYGPKEFLNNGEYGDLFSVGDYRHLAKLILKNYKTNINLKKRQNWILQFDKKNTLEKYIEIFNSL